MGLGEGVRSLREGEGKGIYKSFGIQNIFDLAILKF